MIYIIETNLKLVGDSLTNKEDLAQLDTTERNEHFKTAVEWFARYYIRIHQDAACYENPKVIIDRIEEYLKTKPFAQTIRHNISIQEFNKICLEQIPWVQQVTEDPFFAAPAAVGFYLKVHYPHNKYITLRNYPIPQDPSPARRDQALIDRWKEERQNALIQFERGLALATQ